MVIMMFVILFLLIMMGIPIAFGMGLTSLTTLLILGKVSLISSLAQSMYAQATSFPLLAIPFFILAASFMNTGGITDRVFRFANCLVGHLPGGLAHVNVVASMICAGMTGSAVAEAAGLGKVMIRAMEERGFDKPFSAAVTAAGSTIGPIIPPSIPFVVYGSITGLSVGKLFLGGLLPGVGMGIFLMVTIYIMARRRKYPKDSFPPLKKVLAAGWDAIPALMSPVIIILGMTSGFFTATEAAVVVSAYSLLIGIMLGGIRLSNIVEIFYESLIQTVKVMFIIVIAVMFGWLLVYLRASDKMVGLFISISSNPLIILLMIMILLLILGCFMESIAIILTVVPMLIPLSTKVGMDPIHFGVVIVLALMVGLITPPVGMSVFAVAAITDLAPEVIFRASYIFIISLALLLILVAVWPGLTLFVPNLLLRH